MQAKHCRSRVTPLAVIKAFDIFLDCCLRIGPCGIAVVVHQLVFETAPEAFQRGVVIAVPFARHTKLCHLCFQLGNATAAALGVLPHFAALTQFASVPFGMEIRSAAFSSVSPCARTSFTASSRRSGVYVFSFFISSPVADVYQTVVSEKVRVPQSFVIHGAPFTGKPPKPLARMCIELAILSSNRCRSFSSAANRVTSISFTHSP